MARGGLSVTIIGAGIVGYAVAYELAWRGAKVRIIDPRGAGLGATQASAGILAPYVEGHADTLLELAVAGMSCYDSFVGRVKSDSNLPIEYRKNGTLQVARDASEGSDLRQAAARLAAAGVTHTLLDAREVNALEPAVITGICNGLRVPEHGHIIASQFTAALRESLQRRGVDVIVEAAQRVEPSNGHVRVATSREVFESDAVVIAAGSWSSQLTVPSSPVSPIRGQLLHVRFPEAPVSHVVWGSRCYLVPWTDGSVLIGATVEDVGFDESATVDGVRQLLAAATDLVPAVETARFIEVRVGLRPKTPDELPVIGASSTMRGVYYATGHYRNGVLLAPLTALMLTELMLDGRERPEMALVNPARFGL